METIALLGTTGSLGRALGPMLAAAGSRYRAVSRSALALQVRVAPDPLVQPMQWDPEGEPRTIEAVLEGASAAVYLVGMPVWQFEKHLGLTRQVLEAAAAGGVKRFLLVSSNWAYGRPDVLHVSEKHPLSAHTVKGRIRAEQEARVLEANGVRGLQTAVLRVADFYGPYVEASYLWGAFRAAKSGKQARLPAPVDTPHEFVFVPDAARTVQSMLESPAVWGQAWNLGGAGATSVRRMTEAIFAQARIPAAYEVTPGWKMRIVAMMNPYVRAMEEMRYLLEMPLMLDDTALSAALGGLRKTAYADGCAQTLPTMRAGR